MRSWGTTRTATPARRGTACYVGGRRSQAHAADFQLTDLLIRHAPQRRPARNTHLTHHQWDPAQDQPSHVPARWRAAFSFTIASVRAPAAAVKPAPIATVGVVAARGGSGLLRDGAP